MIRVLKSGLYTTIQDQGRFGYREKGVPVSGVMDVASASLANMLLGNSKNKAVMEITVMGPQLEFTKNTCIVITGAEMNVKINSTRISNNRVYDITKGDILTFGSAKRGCRAYVAIKNGFKTEQVLGSRSQYETVTEQKCISNGDEIHFVEFSFSKMSESNVRIKPNWLERNTLKIFKGPEFELLNEGQKKQLLKMEFTISKENNRMAYQLQENLSSHNHSILTSATLPGTVQLTPSGQLIVLMKDAQTTGGYPRVLQLTDEAICILSQKRTGNQINFKL